MSPRAAWRLETLGFGPVYDYVGGKAEPRAGGLARRNVPTCALDDDLDEVRRRVREAGWDTCFVVTPRRVVLGRLGRRALAGSGGTVEEAMSEGPSTFRPGAPVEALRRRMDRDGLTSLPVTRADGTLVGLLLREDADRDVQ